MYTSKRMDTLLNEQQEILWNFLAKSTTSITYLSEDIHVDVQYSKSPLFVTDIFANHLFNESNSLFEKIIPYDGPPRISGALYKKDTILAHALLMPTVVQYCESAEVPFRRLGVKLGTLGVYVSPCHRGNGYAKACVQALAMIINTVQQEHLPKCCLIGEKHVLSLYQSYFRIPVIARYACDRSPEHIVTYSRFSLQS